MFILPIILRIFGPQIQKWFQDRQQARMAQSAGASATSVANAMQAGAEPGPAVMAPAPTPGVIQAPAPASGPAPDPAYTAAAVAPPAVAPPPVAPAPTYPVAQAGDGQPAAQADLFGGMLGGGAQRRRERRQARRGYRR